MGLFNYLWYGSRERPHVHDWECVAFETRYGIEQRIHRELRGALSPPVYIDNSESYDAYGNYKPEPQQRVCVTCGKCEDQIADYEADVRRRIRESEERKAKAIELWSACRSGQDNVEA